MELDREDTFGLVVQNKIPSEKDKYADDISKNTQHPKDKEHDSADPELNCLSQREVCGLVAEVPENVEKYRACLVLLVFSP